MTPDERLALIWEASDAVGDDALLLAVLSSLRDGTFRASVRALIEAPHAGAALRVMTPVMAVTRTVPANAADHAPLPLGAPEEEE